MAPANDDDKFFEAEPEEHTPDITSKLTPKAGWGGVKRALESGLSTIEFKFTEEAQLVRFTDPDPFAIYASHFIQETIPGRRLFVCLASAGDTPCPLCAVGHEAKTRAAFSLVNFRVGSDEKPGAQWVEATSPLLKLLMAKHEGTRSGPLDRHYYSMARHGKGPSTQYDLELVRSSQLEEDGWGLTPESADRIMQECGRLFTAKDLGVVGAARLREVVKMMQV